MLTLSVEGSVTMMTVRTMALVTEAVWPWVYTKSLSN